MSAERWVRPSIEIREFRDEAGNVIPYGERWEASPDESSYSICAHPERFEPVAVVADALVEFLAGTYQVSVSQLDSRAACDAFAREDVLRATRLVPVSGASAPMVVGFIGDHGVLVKAGVAWRGVYPFCNCDACDEDVERVIDDFEREVFAIVEGGLVERVEGALKRRLSVGLVQNGRAWLVRRELLAPRAERAAWKAALRARGAEDRSIGGFARRLVQRGSAAWTPWTPRPEYMRTH